MKKRNQHYVFQAYLKKWHNKEKRLWCLENGKIELRDTIEVAQEEDFYRISKLNDDEIKFLEYFWSDHTSIIQKQLMSHLRQYQISFVWENELALCNTIVDEINTTGSITKETNDELLALSEYLCECLKNASSDCDDKGRNEKALWQNEIKHLGMLILAAGCVGKNKGNAGIIAIFNETMKMLENLVDEATNDLEEDFLSSIESETSRWMQAFKKRNFATIEKQDKRELFLDIVIHYFRTKKNRDILQKNFQNIFSDAALMKKFQEFQPNINPTNIRPESIKHLIFWDWQTALANSLYAKKACITLLVNETTTPFITSDQPLINLKADHENPQQLQKLQPCEVKELLFYYPLSPRIAITIDADNSSEQINTINLQTKDVEEYNDKMVKASHEIIFANGKDILEKIIESKNNDGREDNKDNEGIEP